jgi:hypothetical protein
MSDGPLELALSFLVIDTFMGPHSTQIASRVCQSSPFQPETLFKLVLHPCLENDTATVD